MDREGIKDVLAHLGVHRSTLEDRGGWVMTRCLLAPWTHATGKDSRPSAGISVHDDDRSIYHCFTCQEKGPLVRLVEQIEKYSGDDYSDLKEGWLVDEELGPPLPPWERTGPDPREVLGDPLGDEYRDLYEWPGGYPEARRYLVSRGINSTECRKLGLQYDPTESRIVFPVCDTKGNLYGYSGRSILKTESLKVKDYFGLPKRLLLLGADRLEGATEVLLCEGLFDYAWLKILGFPAVAMMGTELTDAKAEILIDIGLPVYAFTDNDRAGYEAARKAADKLIWHIPVLEVEYPDYCQYGDDPAVLSRREVETMMVDAEIFSF